jgi:hypothetical protein
MTSRGLGFTVELRSMKPTTIKERTVYALAVESEEDKEALSLMTDLEFAIEAVMQNHKATKVQKSIVVSDRFKTKEVEAASPIREG